MDGWMLWKGRILFHPLKLSQRKREMKLLESKLVTPNLQFRENEKRISVIYVFVGPKEK